MDNAGCLKQNIGSTDRIVRLVIAIVLWIWPLSVASTIFSAEILAAIGGILLATVISGYCPLYHALGWSTRKERTRA